MLLVISHPEFRQCGCFLEVLNALSQCGNKDMGDKGSLVVLRHINQYLGRFGSVTQLIKYILNLATTTYSQPSNHFNFFSHCLYSDHKVKLPLSNWASWFCCGICYVRAD